MSDNNNYHSGVSEVILFISWFSAIVSKISGSDIAVLCSIIFSLLGMYKHYLEIEKLKRK